MKYNDLLGLSALTFFISFIVFTFLEIVFITIFEKLKLKKITDFLGEFFFIIAITLSGLFTILCLFKYFKELN